MLQRVMLDGIELPRLYIAENYEDAMLAKSKGIPFIRWKQGQDALIRMLLRPVLEDMFPHIKWDMVLGRRKRVSTKVVMCEVEEQDHQLDVVDNIDDKAGAEAAQEEGKQMEGDPFIHDNMIAGIAEDERLFYNEHANTMLVERKMDLEDYVGDMSSYVNIEVLQRLRLMPAFIGDILDCVKLNIGSGMHWAEGYNKRLGLPVGRYNSSGQLPNLVILDVSGSIPRGISATMISLIDTLRTQLSADLIITGSNSRFYKMGDELPSPQRIRDMFGYNNESWDFFRILDTNIRGKHYGHVFSFGDDDTPNYFYFKENGSLGLAGTKVEHVHHYHTWRTRTETGYAKWCQMLSVKPKVDYDNSWCDVIMD